MSIYNKWQKRTKHQASDLAEESTFAAFDLINANEKLSAAFNGLTEAERNHLMEEMSGNIGLVIEKHKQYRTSRHIPFSPTFTAAFVASFIVGLLVWL